MVAPPSSTFGSRRRRVTGVSCCVCPPPLPYRLGISKKRAGGWGSSNVSASSIGGCRTIGGRSVCTSAACSSAIMQYDTKGGSTSLHVLCRSEVGSKTPPKRTSAGRGGSFDHGTVYFVDILQHSRQHVESLSSVKGCMFDQVGLCTAGSTCGTEHMIDTFSVVVKPRNGGALVWPGDRFTAVPANHVWTFVNFGQEVINVHTVILFDSSHAFDLTHNHVLGGKEELCPSIG